MGAELKHDALIVGTVTAQQKHAAAVHIADRIAAEHPHQSAAEIAANPVAAAGLLELLDQLGLRAHLQRSTP